MEVRLVRIRKSYVVSLIAFFVVFMVPLLYQNSKFRLFERVPKGMKLRGTTQNITTEFLTKAPNVTMNSFGFRGRAQNITHDISEGRNIFKRSKGGSLKSSTSHSHQHIGIPHDNVDKLLEGLLVNGFDKSSCISRLQSHLYRKASPHKPSSYLISKLRNYEKIHRRCGPYSRAYKRDMRNIARSKDNTTSTTTCKYIIWTPANGLGNQIISMTSTFLYALLTDRVFLVKFGEDKFDLFCEPFLNSTWLLPENTRFKHVRTLQSIVDEDFPSPVPAVLFVDLRFHPGYPERYFHCDDSQNFLSEVPLLILQADQYFVPSLFMTPLFNEDLNKMFPNIDTIFHHLGRYIFHPSNKAWEIIKDLYQAHFAKADEKVGLQIRVYDWSSTPQEVFMKQVLNCTIQNKLLPRVGVPLQSSVSSGNKQSVKAVLVASLSPEYGKDLRTIYMNKSTITGEVIQVFQPSSEEYQKLDDTEQNMNAWVEMYLLSLSDVLVTTFQSTFGYVAKGLGNSRAWLLYKSKNDEIPSPACDQEFLLEPCYHAPPYHRCDGKHIYDFTSFFPYVRHCKDYPFGVKLINSSSSIYM